jgi:group II intron reverse transcriptase/maturase
MVKVNSLTTLRESGKSDELIVPQKQPNKGLQGPAEAVEGRGSIKRNAKQDAGTPAQNGISATSRLLRVRQVAAKDRRTQFTSLFHHLTRTLLTDSFYKLKRRSTPGVDGLSWQAYAQGLDERLIRLLHSLHSGSYRPTPARRIQIPKADGSLRPLSILCLEDKLVQQATVTLMQHIYEEDFLGFSYGFRPGRGQHDALDALYVGIKRRKVNWVLDLDIRKFFDRVEHDWLITFIQHRIKDKRLIRLLTQWMKVGHYDEDGRHVRSARGVPQGAVISPLLANIYLHYCMDLWINQWRKRQTSGDVIVVRYADDAVLGFQRKDDAEAFLSQLHQRLDRFGLSLNEDKTKLIRFGRFARKDCATAGLPKPESFDFLGFTHSCAVLRDRRTFMLLRQTSVSRTRRTLHSVKDWLYRNRHRPVGEQKRWLAAVMRGHLNYFAVPGNVIRVSRFHTELGKLWMKALRRRSQRYRLVWARFGQFLRDALPQPRVVHPWPNKRFDGIHSR